MGDASVIRVGMRRPSGKGDAFHSDPGMIMDRLQVSERQYVGGLRGNASPLRQMYRSSMWECAAIVVRATHSATILG